MNGAESLIRTLVNCGVDVCFGNPGTSEMHFVAALDRVPEMRPVLCLFEGVATGAADGYARMADRPASVLLHLGPGLANGLANLHNARRAGTPVVVIVGDHATHHLQHDAPLTSDIAGFASPVSPWVRSARSALALPGEAARAVQASMTPPGAIATLIVPADTAWGESQCAAQPLPCAPRATVAGETIDEVAQLLRNGRRTAILLRGRELTGAGLEAAGRVAARTGARLICDTFSPRADLGAGRIIVERIPYLPEAAIHFLSGTQQIVLVGTRPPVSMFAYPGIAGVVAPADCRFALLAGDHEDGTQALQALDEALGGSAPDVNRHALNLPPLPTGALNLMALAQAIAHLTPEHVVVVDESVTSSLMISPMLSRARPIDHVLATTGGAIGQGLPVAVGAAIACPDRKVICLEGDGSAAYTLQALWTMARERLDVTVVICANRSYAILNLELAHMRGPAAGTNTLSLLDLHNPEMNWSRIAEGLGVEASRATTGEEFAAQYASAMQQRGPRLIEALI